MKHKYYFAAVLSATLLLTGCQQNQTAESEPEPETSTQTSAETQVSESEATSISQTSASTLKPVTEVSNTTQVSSTETGVSASEVSSTTQATTKAQSSSSDNNSNNNSNSNSNTQKSKETQPASQDDNYTFRLDSIGQPGNMSSFIMADRTSDGFGCITYNYNDSRMYYHHFSEDLQTSNTTAFEIPELDGYHFTPNYHYYYD